MNRRAFEELNRSGGVVSATYMHQRRLRQHHDLPRGFGLCSALVEVWWEAARVGRAATAVLERDSASFVLDRGRYSTSADKEINPQIKYKSILYLICVNLRNLRIDSVNPDFVRAR